MKFFIWEIGNSGFWAATACAVGENLEQAEKALEQHLKKDGCVEYMWDIKMTTPIILDGPAGFLVEQEA